MYDLKKYLSKKVHGIIHVGANTGQEVPYYKTLCEKIYLFEPVPDVFQTLKSLESDTIKCYNCAIGEFEGIQTLYLCSNNNLSASLLAPALHKHMFGVKFEGTIQVQVKRLSSFAFYKECNVLVIDVQGAEIGVLNSIEDFSGFDLIMTEVSNCQLYEGNAIDTDIQAMLSVKGFRLAFKSYSKPLNYITDVQDKSLLHGDAIFIKNQDIKYVK